MVAVRGDARRRAPGVKGIPMRGRASLVALPSPGGAVLTQLPANTFAETPGHTAANVPAHTLTGHPGPEPPGLRAAPYLPLTGEGRRASQ